MHLDRIFWSSGPELGTIRAMQGFWAVFWLALVLKIPIFALLYLVYWAIKQSDVEPEPADDGGGSDRHGRGPRIRPPRPPRRGPHADPAPRPPKRVRAEARPLSPTRH
jgi:hypothetical protein